jgi:hypothetical protein
LIPVGWSPREEPLPPEAVAGRGRVAVRLAERVLGRSEAWRGVVGDDLIVVLGPDLPWVDGVTYLGRDPRAPTLWFDTRVQPDVPPALLARAVARRVPGPVAWLADPTVLVPLGAAEPFHPPALGAWLAERR